MNYQEEIVVFKNDRIGDLMTSVPALRILIKENFIELSNQKVQTSYISKAPKKFFIIVFFLFAFGWNPKVVMVDDVASKPIYATPYKFYKYFIRDKF